MLKRKRCWGLNWMLNKYDWGLKNRAYEFNGWQNDIARRQYTKHGAIEIHVIIYAKFKSKMEQMNKDIKKRQPNRK